LGTEMEAHPRTEFLLDFEGEAIQMPEAAGEYVLGTVAEASRTRFWDPPRDRGRGGNCRS